jgi:hypothetical protein
MSEQPQAARTDWPQISDIPAAGNPGVRTHSQHLIYLQSVGNAPATPLIGEGLCWFLQRSI